MAVLGGYYGAARMKLNFWQWVGVILLVGGAAWLIFRENKGKPAPGVPNNLTTPAATQPK